MENTNLEEKKGKGCLKGCLIIILIPVVLFIILVAYFIVNPNPEDHSTEIDSVKNTVFEYDTTRTIGAVLESSMTDIKWEYDNRLVVFTGIDPEKKKWKFIFGKKKDENDWEINAFYCDKYNFSPYGNDSGFDALMQAVYDGDFDFDPKTIQKLNWQEKKADEKQTKSTENTNASSQKGDMTVHTWAGDFIIPAYTNESEDAYRASCGYIEDISLLKRYPDEYYGKRYRIDCKIYSVFREGDFYRERTQYQIDDYGGYGVFHVLDFRTTDTTRILKDDNITVYGEFVGLYDNEYPLFAMKYADIKAIQ